VAKDHVLTANDYKTIYRSIKAVCHHQSRRNNKKKCSGDLTEVSFVLYFAHQQSWPKLSKFGIPSLILVTLWVCKGK